MGVRNLPHRFGLEGDTTCFKTLLASPFCLCDGGGGRGAASLHVPQSRPPPMSSWFAVRLMMSAVQHCVAHLSRTLPLAVAVADPSATTAAAAAPAVVVVAASDAAVEEMVVGHFVAAAPEVVVAEVLLHSAGEDAVPSLLVACFRGLQQGRKLLSNQTVLRRLPPSVLQESTATQSVRQSRLCRS